MDKFESFLTSYIPLAGTQARLLLELLLEGKEYTTKELYNKLDADPRSSRQALIRDWKWLIHNNGGKKGRYKLDSRHLSKDEKLDREARVEAELMYKTRSLGLSKREAARLPKAEIDLILAEKKAESNQDELDL